MRIVVVLVLGLTILLPALGQEEGDRLTILISKLSAEEFSTRREAVRQLAELAGTEADEVLQAVVAVNQGSDPEGKLRAQEVLRQIFERHELGLGSPRVGVTWNYFVWLKEDIPRTAAMVEKVAGGSPAAKSKLRFGDVVSKINGEAVEGPDAVRQVRRILSRKKPGEVVAIHVRRFRKDARPGRVWSDGPRATIKVTLGAPRKSGVREEREGEYSAWLKGVEARYAKEK